MSALPKVLHPIGNAPMLYHAMSAAAALHPTRMVIVAGHEAEMVKAAAVAFEPTADVAVQSEQLGTGHAVLVAGAELASFSGDLYVLFGDTPFISAATLVRMQELRKRADFVALGFKADDPARYGRFLVSEGDKLEGIVEAKDASQEQLAINLCNSGLMCGNAREIQQLLRKVRNDNAQQEYYLTDLIGIAVNHGLSCRFVLCEEEETLGINDRLQLARAEQIFQSRARRNALAGGATLISPDTVFFSLDTHLAKDVTVHPNVVFGPGVQVGEGSEIKSFCHLEDTVLSPDVKVGPFARLRGGTELSQGVRIGNFVEAKNAKIASGTKAGHLSYLGDAVIGKDVNIGAGTVTCNFDGYQKQQTTIDHEAFIGVNTALIAPVTVGQGGYVGTGTVVTQDVPEQALALSRTPQVNRRGAAKRLRSMLAARASMKKAK